MKILIVVIRFNFHNSTKADYNYHLPVGLAYISSILKKNGYSVKWLNLNHHDGTMDDLIRRTLSQEKFDFILAGGLSIFYPVFKSCINSIRKYAPHIPVVLGGGMVSSQPELIFNLLKPDFIVIGEGEMTILELLECVENNGNLNEVAGIGYLGTDGKLVLTEARKAIKDIDSLPYPDYEGLGYDAYLEHMIPRPTDPYYDLFDEPRAYPLVSSRSCPFSCTFCFHPIGNIYRQRSVSSIMDELNFAINRYRINIIHIMDELFSYNKERVYEFCTQIKQLFKTIPWEVRWNCQIRVDKLDEELLTTMKDAGCYILSLGLESYSPAVLKSMKKKITPQQIDNTLQMTRRLNMTIQGNFIFFDAAETKETAYETLNYWKKSVYSGGGINLFYIQPYPGTSLYKHCVDKAIIKDEADFIENITTWMAKPINMSNTMTDKEFRQFYIDIYEAERKYQKYVKPLSVISDNGKYEIRVKCPYCNIVSTYKNFTFDKYSYGIQHISCRNCRMRFYLQSVILKIEVLLIKFIGSKNVILMRNFMKKILKTIRFLNRNLASLISIFHYRIEKVRAAESESGARDI